MCGVGSGGWGGFKAGGRGQSGGGRVQGAGREGIRWGVWRDQGRGSGFTVRLFLARARGQAFALVASMGSGCRLLYNGPLTSPLQRPEASGLSDVLKVHPAPPFTPNLIPPPYVPLPTPDTLTPYPLQDKLKTTGRGGDARRNDKMERRTAQQLSSSASHHAHLDGGGGQHGVTHLHRGHAAHQHLHHATGRGQRSSRGE